MKVSHGVSGKREFCGGGRAAFCKQVNQIFRGAESKHHVSEYHSQALRGIVRTGTMHAAATVCEWNEATPLISDTKLLTPTVYN